LPRDNRTASSPEGHTSAKPGPTSVISRVLTVACTVSSAPAPSSMSPPCGKRSPWESDDGDGRASACSLSDTTVRPQNRGLDVAAPRSAIKRQARPLAAEKIRASGAEAVATRPSGAASPVRPPSWADRRHPQSAATDKEMNAKDRLAVASQHGFVTALPSRAIRLPPSDASSHRGRSSLPLLPPEGRSRP
jgi:hypothetical protein